MMYWKDVVERNHILFFTLSIVIRIVIIINRIKRLWIKPDESLVIISYHKLGDTVFTIPTIKNILDKSKIKIYLFCLRESIPIYQYIFGNKLQFEGFNRDDFLFEERYSKPVVRKRFKSVNPTTVIDLTGTPRSVTTFLFNNCREIVGFNQKVFKPFYTLFNEIKNLNHITQIYSQAVSGYISVRNERINGRNRIKTRKTKPILIHPFAGWPAKEWGLKNFIELAGELNKVTQCKIIIPEKTVSNELVNEIAHSGVQIVETKNVQELIENINDAWLLVGNDSAAVNLAVLLDVPAFTIFGPSNPALHFMQSPQSDYIIKLLPCSPRNNEKLCFTNGGRDGCPSNECMKLLELSAVLNKVKALIKKLSENDI